MPRLAGSLLIRFIYGCVLEYQTLPPKYAAYYTCIFISRGVSPVVLWYATCLLRVFLISFRYSYLSYI
ncbi:hypothetical protein F4820DRAFT_408374 [Hypoxylon rubiginosum]|uniref:Uncharacterized protein n=1 Tax=Hypoxylon rubiginosum TaxID=110542 RepID=A0ACB9ZBZ5_9PEZI|nr:hypothetical protein F4820DRAFT_408374 [Hypoxylon rubiginosum]